MGAIMKHQIIAATILGVAILVAVGVSIYFSPYQSCVRSVLVADRIGSPMPLNSPPDWDEKEIAMQRAGATWSEIAEIEKEADRRFEAARAHITCAAR
jgi:hypothetical protein